jgi:hypothetical protein
MHVHVRGFNVHVVGTCTCNIKVKRSYEHMRSSSAGLELGLVDYAISTNFW